MNFIDICTKTFESGGQIDIIYTDFEKAFDKVPHKRLLSKLKSYGVQSDIIKWVEIFLCYRKHQVRINGRYSHWMDVLSGIPQGSVLGPLLFVIYINDLPEVCDRLCNLFLFADDAKLFKHINNDNDSAVLQECCHKLYSWSENWLMKLNIDKCKILTIARPRSAIEHTYGFNVNNVDFVELEKVTNMKDLGVIIDNELSFKEHIHEKVNKAFQMIGIINRSFQDIDKNYFLLIYKSTVKSHLEYANSVWNPYKSHLIDQIEVSKREQPSW